MTEIRPARATDQASIRAIVRAARLYPLGLSWGNFLLAEQKNQVAQNGQTVGVGQVRPHGDGSRELASIAVLPPFQGQGIGDRLVLSLLVREPGPLYLMCAEERVSFYTRFNFRVIAAHETPPSLRWKVWVGTVAASVASTLGLEVGRVTAMKWEGDSE